MEILNDIVKLVGEGGWIAVWAYVAFLTHKTTMVGIITLALYRAIKLIVSARTSRTLEMRIAAEMGTITPLSPNEETKILEAVRRIIK